MASMVPSPLVISLPIGDRQRSFEFYRTALDLVAIGEPAEDGVPEPLQFALNPHHAPDAGPHRRVRMDHR